MQPEDLPEPKLPDAARGHDASKKPTSASRDGDRDMGSALRSVYQKTVDESVPADLLDLLGKLD